MQDNYTKQEVESILLALFLVSGANDNQGLKVIEGLCYGDKMETVLIAFNNSNKSAVSIVSEISKTN